MDERTLGLLGKNAAIFTVAGDPDALPWIPPFLRDGDGIAHQDRDLIRALG
jgi:hypothetical protein